MKQITCPAAVKVGTETVDLYLIVERFLLNTDFWRTRNHAPLALSLMDKMDKKPKQLRVTDAEAEALEKSMQLAGQVIDPPMNRIYLRCLAAVCQAETIAEDPEAPAA